MTVRERLSALRQYLRARRAIEIECRLQWSGQKTEENDQDPRAFAEVRTNPYGVIFATKRIACLHPRNQYAILLHEIGHIHLDALDGPESEPTVDVWIHAVFPHAMYHYEDAKYNLYGVQRIAKNLQIVSREFIYEVNEWVD